MKKTDIKEEFPKRRKGITANKQAVMIDDDVWIKSGPILKSVGLSRSAYLNACLKVVLGLDKQSIEDMFLGMVTDLMKESKVNLDDVLPYEKMEKSIKRRARKKQ